MQLHKVHKYGSELEQSGGRRGRAEAEGVRGSQRWVEKGKGGHTMTERPDMLRLGVSCLYREHHESDPRDINTPFKNTNNCSGELLSENPSRLWGILHIFNFACSWLKAVLKMMRHPQFWRKYGHFMGLETCQVGSDWLEGQVIRWALQG